MHKRLDSKHKMPEKLQNNQQDSIRITLLIAPIIFKEKNLSSVKQIADVYAKVPLKPYNISICSMHDLIKLNADTHKKKPFTK